MNYILEIAKVYLFLQIYIHKNSLNKKIFFNIYSLVKFNKMDENLNTPQNPPLQQTAVSGSACLHDFVIKFGEYECQNCGQLHEDIFNPKNITANIVKINSY
jgi:hemolysin-activating ACP:hemolysin acyltransferase